MKVSLVMTKDFIGLLSLCPRDVILRKGGRKSKRYLKLPGQIFQNMFLKVFFLNNLIHQVINNMLTLSILSFPI